MSELILIRHSLPQIDPSVPAALWNLSEEGRHRCHTLAEKLADEYDIDVIVSSAEPKAYETGCIIAKILGKPISTAEGLHEHQRKHIGLLAREEFETRVAEFFAEPEQLVFGDETADQAHRRFAAAIYGLIASHASKTIAVVTHGTVMTLFISRAMSLETFPLWKQLGLPGFAVLSLPELNLVRLEM